MSKQISALELTSLDLVREVSQDTISFYVDELSDVYLPKDFRLKQANVRNVRNWSPDDRFNGKFGRFTLQFEGKEGDQDEPLDDILVMGSTIGVGGLDRFGNAMRSLRHVMFNDKIGPIIKKRGLSGENISVKPADYGHTKIHLDSSGTAQAIVVSDKSYDFGRADKEGRETTCQRFGNLMGSDFEVVNLDPERRHTDKILE